MHAALETAKDHGHRNSGPRCAGPSPCTPGSRHPILTLQQQAGNQVVQSQLSQAGVYPKLSSSQPDDPAEREADQVAGHIMRSHTGPSVSWPCSCASGEQCEECSRKPSAALARKTDSASRVKGTERSRAPQIAAGHAPAIVRDVLRAPGRLDSATRAFFEPRFGFDFGQVRLHTDESATRSARAIDARAYTLGQSIVFGQHQFAPNSRAGALLLAHELTHVIQQAGNPAAPARLQRQAATDQPNKTEEAAGARLRALAARPAQPIGQWPRLQSSERSFIVMTMAGRYGSDFAQDFLNYAGGRKKPDLSTEVSNTETAETLTARGFRFAGNYGGVPLWVHPSGHEVELLSPGQKPAQETPKDRAFRLCSDALMMGGPAICNQCCETNITGTSDYDEESRKACKELCGG
jgi:hypothetical protein